MRTIAARYLARLEPMLGEITRADGATRADSNNLANEVEVLGLTVRTAIASAVGPAYGRMASGVADASDKVIGVTLRDIAGRGAGSARVTADIDAARDRNIRLVEEAARVYAADVRAVVSDPRNFGLRVEQVKAKLVERGNVAESRAELIARDQTLKLNGQIAQQRMARAGITKYTWSTSGDERVRPEHAALEGQVFSWDSPPPPGHPGQDFQCRCVAVPVVEEAEGLFGSGVGVPDVAPAPAPPPVVLPLPGLFGGLDPVAAPKVSFPVDREAARAVVERLGPERVALRRVPLSKIEPPSTWSVEKAKAIEEAMASGKALPPVRLLRTESGRYTITDGNHRVAAARAAGHTHIPAIVDR